MTDSKLTGGCLCKKVRYEFESDKISGVVCACEDCQKASGSLFAYAVAANPEAFSVTSGDDVLKEFTVVGDSGKEVKRYFCSNCGTPVFAKPEGYPMFMSIKAPTLDTPIDSEPKFAIYQKNIPTWLKLPEEALAQGQKMGG